MPFILFVFLAIFAFGSKPATATVPLINAGEWAGMDWKVWWSPNALLITEGESQTGYMPLENYRSASLSKAKIWKQLNEKCQKPLTTNATLFGKQATVVVIPEPNKLIVDIQIEKIVVAKGIVSRPVTFCDLHVIEADSITGPELILIWSLNDSLIGLTALRIPETIR